MSRVDHEIRPDLPINSSDFQLAAVNQGARARDGTRLYRDTMFRGRFFHAARNRYLGQPLNDQDYAQLGAYPEDILKIHYFGNVPHEVGAISLNGLRETLRLGLLDGVALHNNSRFVLREAILGEVIAEKLTEQYQLLHEVE